MPTATMSYQTSTVQFQIYEGQILLAQPQGDYYRRVGARGSGSQELGTAGPESPIIAHFLTTSAGIAASVKAILASWQGKYVTVFEPDGTFFSSVLVREALPVKRVGKYPWSGTTYTHRVICQFTLEAQ